MGKKKRIKNELSKLESKYVYGIYKIPELAKMRLAYGDVIIPQNDIVMALETLPTKKIKVDTVDRAFDILTPKTNLNNSSLLITRYGGIGDIVSTLFGIAALKQKFKNLKVGYVASPSYSSILTMFPTIVDEIFAPIINIKDVRKYQNICILDNTLEIDPEAEEKPIQEIYAKYMGISLDKNSVMGLIMNNFAVQNKRQRTGIGLQYSCDVPLRNYNLDNTINLINLLIKEFPNEKIHLLGKPDDLKMINYISSKVTDESKLIINGCGFPKITLKDILLLTNTLKVVIGPDSGMLHLAGISNTPIVGLFGPFPSNLRLSYYLDAIGIDAKTNCSPCFRHFPLNFCKYNSGDGVCLNSINPETIIEQVKKFI
jgi:ADP-heptose:LPS heptosyltransferase